MYTSVDAATYRRGRPLKFLKFGMLGEAKDRPMVQLPCEKKKIVMHTRLM